MPVINMASANKRVQAQLDFRLIRVISRTTNFCCFVLFTVLLFVSKNFNKVHILPKENFFVNQNRPASWIGNMLVN